MIAGSGLLLPALDELVDRARPGVLAVLDAADALHRQIETAEFRASLAPSPTHYAQCVCGSVMQIFGELDADDYDAIRDWQTDHEECCEDHASVGDGR